MTKIEALEKTIYNLENNVYEYSWENSDSCNCGILSRTIIGKSVFDAGYGCSPCSSGVGAFASEAFCMTTDLRLPEVFQALKDTGFTYQEILELEYLGNQEIAHRAGQTVTQLCSRSINAGSYKNKETLIAYLIAWVQLLKEELAEKTPEVRIKTVYVSVPVSITEQIKELIQS